MGAGGWLISPTTAKISVGFGYPSDLSRSVNGGGISNDEMCMQGATKLGVPGCYPAVAKNLAES
jgi:hypothetical protein